MPEAVVVVGVVLVRVVVVFVVVVLLFVSTSFIVDYAVMLSLMLLLFAFSCCSCINF